MLTVISSAALVQECNTAMCCARFALVSVVMQHIMRQTLCCSQLHHAMDELLPVEEKNGVLCIIAAVFI